MESLINFVQDQFIEKKEFPEFSAGDTITIYYEIREGEKVRTQFYRGVVIQIKGQGLSKTFTIRKMSGTVSSPSTFLHYKKSKSTNADGFVVHVFTTLENYVVRKLVSKSVNVNQYFKRSLLRPFL
jgi:ribosomal protein L19